MNKNAIMLLCGALFAIPAALPAAVPQLKGSQETAGTTGLKVKPPTGAQMVQAVTPKGQKWTFRRGTEKWSETHYDAREIWYGHECGAVWKDRKGNRLRRLRRSVRPLKKAMPSARTSCPAWQATPTRSRSWTTKPWLARGRVLQDGCGDMALCGVQARAGGDAHRMGGRGTARLCRRLPQVLGQAYRCPPLRAARDKVICCSYELTGVGRIWYHRFMICLARQIPHCGETEGRMLFRVVYLAP